MDKILKLQQEKDDILKKINEKKNEINNNYSHIYVNANKLKTELNVNLSAYNSKKRYITDNIDILNVSEILTINSELKELCKKISAADKKYKAELITANTNKNIVSKKPKSQLEAELNTEETKLKNKLEEIGNEREKNRIDAINSNNQTNGIYSKIWIDKDLGIYVWYDKISVISQTMKCFFNVTENLTEEDLKLSLFGNRDNMLETISNVKIPGLPALLSLFIDLVVKAVGEYAKQFYFFKNTIDSVAGLDIPEIFGNIVPAAPTVINDMITFFTSTDKWISKKLMSPIFDSNLPIPSIGFNLGSIIPVLPFNLKIPKIDPYGIFDGVNTEKYCDYSNKVENFLLGTANMYTELVNKQSEAEKKEKERLNNEKEKKLESLNLKIKDKTQDYVGTTPFIYKSKILKIEDDIDFLVKQYNNIKNDLKYNDYLYTDNRILELENELKYLCQRIKLLTRQKSNLNAQLIKSTNQTKTKAEIYKELQDLIKQKNDLKNTDIKSSLDFAKRASLIQMQLNIDVDNLETKIKKIYDLGYNVFDNKALEYLEKIGYNFSSNKYFEDLMKLKNLGIPLNNAKNLKRLNDLGFNLNDPSHYTKLIKLKNYINIADTRLLNIYKDFGFNFNNPNVFNILKNLYDLKIDLNNVDLMIRLNTIGFNFNIDNIVEKMTILRKYIDISNNISYDNIITKNINLNNPYFEEALKKFNTISLNFNNDKFKQTEEDILNNVKVTDIDNILNILSKYKKDGNKYHKFLYFTHNSPNSPLPEIYDFLNEMNINISKLANFVYVEYYNTNNPYWTDNNRNIHTYGNIRLPYTEYYDDGLFKSSTSILYCVPINWFKDIINKYQNYNIKIDFKSIIKPFYGDNVYNGLNNTYIQHNLINNKPEIEVKLNTLKSFVIFNGEWVIDGVPISTKINTEDLTKIAEDNNLTIVDSLNITETETTYDLLTSYYGNFDKLGLNIRDNNFTKKFNDLNTIFTINVNESSLLYTKREVWLNFYDKDNDVQRILLGGNNKPDPEVFEDDRTTIDVITVQDNTQPKAEPRSLLYFDALNLIGFNFQNSNYYNILTKLKGMKFVLNKSDVLNIVTSLINIGFNFKNSKSFNWLDELISINFNFEIPDIKNKYVDQYGNTIIPNKNVSSKLDSLNKIGFNFQQTEQSTMMNWLNILGFDMRRDDFENAISELIGFGLSFNDSDWKLKFDKFNSLNIKFNNTNWQTKLQNLIRMGIDFNGSDWLNKYNKINKVKSQGFNYNDNTLTPKMEILNDIGFDFKDDYDNKLTALVKLGAAKKNQDGTMTLANTNKLKMLSKIGLNFCDSNWLKNIDLLVGLGFNLLKSINISDFLNLPIINPFFEFIKTLRKIIITVLTAPIKIIFKIFEMLLNLIKQILSIPLNPSKIPDWFKDIFAKFQELINTMLSLPTKDGISDFLFMSAGGIMFIESFLPGFIEFVNKLTTKIRNYNTEINYLKKSIKDKEALLNLKIKNCEKKKNELRLKISKNESVLNNNGQEAILKIEKAFLLKQNNIITNVNQIKELINSDDTLSTYTLNKLNTELEQYCKTLSRLEKDKNNNINDINNLIKNGNVNNNINDLKNELDSINCNFNDLKIEIKNEKIRLEDLEVKLEKLRKFCNWSKNIDEVLKILKEDEDELKNKKNPYEDKIKDNNDKIEKLRKYKDTLEKNKSLTTNEKSNRIKNDINKLNNDIKEIENFLCKNRYNLSDSEFSNTLEKLNQLKKLKSNYENDLNNNSVDDGIQEKINNINNQIVKLETENMALKLKYKQFEDDRASKISNIDDVKKWLPTVVNIMCCTPKFIANIFVGILNSVGYMKNLPILWDFPYIE